MKSHVSSPRIPSQSVAPSFGSARRPLAAGPKGKPAYVYDLRILALIGEEVVEVLWDRAVDDPAEILVRRINGETFQHPIQLLDNVQLLR